RLPPPGKPRPARPHVRAARAAGEDVKPEGPPMNAEEALRKAIHDSPADDVPRLVLADFLEESGQPERAGLLRLLLALRQAPDAPQAETRERRARRLLAQGVRPCVPVLTNSIGMGFALIPPGSFVMGSFENETHRRGEEGPRHPVTLTRPFY